MEGTRRAFLGLGTSVLATATLGSRALAAGRPPTRAVAFDGFAILDPRPIAARAETLFPGKGPDLMALWRARQFEYTWLRTLGGRYADFWQTAEGALRFAAASLGLALTEDKRDRLLGAYLELAARPDVPEVLRALKKSGVRMAFLSNLTGRMLDSGVARAGLAGLFEGHLSTDRVQAYKPDPRAYQMGVDAFGVTRDEIVFVASAGWDAAGAKWFGYPTVWVNRTAAPMEDLAAVPDASGPDLRVVTGLVRR